MNYDNVISMKPSIMTNQHDMRLSASFDKIV